MKQKLSSGYRYKDQISSYSCVCPSTSKVPYPSDAGRRLGITNFVWSGYWQRLQIMSGNSLVLRPDFLSGHFFMVEVVEQGLSYEGKLGSTFSSAFWEPWSWLSLHAPVSQNSLTLESRQPWSYQKWEDSCDSLWGLRKLLPQCLGCQLTITTDERTQGSDGQGPPSLMESSSQRTAVHTYQTTKCADLCPRNSTLEISSGCQGPKMSASSQSSHGWTLHCVHYQLLWPQDPLPPQEALQNQQEIIKFISIKNQHPNVSTASTTDVILSRAQIQIPPGQDLKELWNSQKAPLENFGVWQNQFQVVGSTGKTRLHMSSSKSSHFTNSERAPLFYLLISLVHPVPAQQSGDNRMPASWGCFED